MIRENQCDQGQRLQLHTKMSKMQGLRVLVKQFLSAAADEILEAVEKTIAGYEECKMLGVTGVDGNALIKPQIKLNRLTISEEAQLHLSVWEEDLLTEQQQEWNSSPRQKSPESLQTEKSHKEPLSSSQDRRPEDDTTNDTFTPQCEKNEHEISKEEEEPLPATSAELQTDEEVPSPRFSEAENDNDTDWRLSDATQDTDSDSEAFQDGNSDRTEELRHRTLTLKTPRMKKKQESCICKVCGKSFHHKVSLLNHLKIHPKDVCGLCGRHFETEEDFKLHLKTHKNFKARVCNVCEKCFGSSRGLETHMRSHTGEKPFTCNECGKSFNVRHNMTRHLRVHTGEKPYSCKTCNKCYSDYTTLKRHKCLQDKTPAVTTAAVEDGDGRAEVKDSTEQVKNMCKVCGAEFHSMVSLVNHTKTHTEDLCGVCGTQFESEESLKLHLQTHRNSNKICEICGKQSLALETHMRSHTGEKPFTCNDCGKSFNVRQNLTRHLRVHTGEKPYSCKTCNKCYSDYTTLKRHKCLQDKTPAVTTAAVEDGDGRAEVKDSTAQVMNKQQLQNIKCKVCGAEFHSMVSLVNHTKTHTEDLCGVCGTQFESEESLKLHLQTHKNNKICEICGKQSLDLETHMRTHTGEKPFSCSVCGKSFSHRQNMKRHHRVHTGEKPYSCSTCNKRFSDYTYSKHHKCLQDKTLAVTTGSTALKTHKYYRKVCGVCGKGFISNTHLETHMRSHTGEKPFSCSVCGKSFRTRQHVKKHLRIHSGEKPYSCTTCNKFYSDYSYLKLHKCCIQENTLAVTTQAVEGGDDNAEGE